MTIEYRPARAGELQATQEHIVRSINDLTVRHGFGPMATVRSPEFQLFSLEDDPGGLWTAEEDGQLVGSAFAWACGSLWFLAELFVSPDRQSAGIGNELLQRLFAHAERSGATCKALLTFAFNRASQGLYIRHGFFPRFPVYIFSAAREALRLPDGQARAVPISDSPDQQRLLALIDQSALGFSRAKHHGYLGGDRSMSGFLIYAGDECLGYAYVNAGGHVGPLAALREDAVAPVFAAALHRAAGTGAAQVSAFISGPSGAALTAATQAGMRIAFPMLLMSSTEFGDWRRYLPRNPGFM
jgi:GNAT superfamily N-acetyltransferase